MVKSFKIEVNIDDCAFVEWPETQLKMYANVNMNVLIRVGN